MEVEEIERQQQQQQKNPSKFSRVGSNRNESTKLCHHYGENNQEEDGLDLIKRPNYSNPLNNGVNDGNNNNNNINSIISSSINDHLCGWHHSSRIIRVSRASGGKDRHSKVWTSKGLRDRRVRLSVSTAIQFYDLQDRLGFDQPSKAVEWLIKAAADSIAELPKLNSSFPLETSLGCQLSDDQKRREQLEAPLDSGEADVDNVEQESNQQGLGLGQQQQQQQHGSLMSKSACSSTSETSKGSGLSLSRGDTRVNRVKARERARERTAKEKEKEKESVLNRVNSNVQQHQHQNISHMSQNSTFTELLTAGISNSNHHSGSGESGSPNDGSTEVTLFHKVAAAAAAAARQWPLTPMDCFGGSGMLGGTPAGSGRTGFPGQIQLGNSSPQGMTMSMLVPQQPTPFSISIGGYNNSNNSHHHHHHHHHQLEQLQHFPFVPDLILPVAAAAGSGGGGGGQGGDYNLNFTISSSSGLAAGFNRGTLQSNSSSPTSSPQHSISTHLQRFSSASANAAASSSPMDGSTNNIPFFIDTSATTTTAMENHHNHQHHHQFPPGLQLLYGDGRHSDHKGKGKS